MLEEVDNPADATKKDSKNLRLIIFRMEQKIEELEKNIADAVISSTGDNEPNAKSDRTHKDETKEDEFLRNRKSSSDVLKNMLTKYDSAINELTAKMCDMEGSMAIIEPENMNKLIKNIAELVVQSEKKPVLAAVDDIKGSQMKNAQLVESIKEEIKEMDERIMRNIKQKIEKKDLYTAKIQLQRKAFFGMKLNKI